jgi:hypothetical protein
MYEADAGGADRIEQGCTGRPLGWWVSNPTYGTSSQASAPGRLALRATDSACSGFKRGRRSHHLGTICQQDPRELTLDWRDPANIVAATISIEFLFFSQRTATAVSSKSSPDDWRGGTPLRVYWIGVKWRNTPVSSASPPPLAHRGRISYARQKNWQKHNKRSNWGRVEIHDAGVSSKSHRRVNMRTVGSS